jgi:hypothetical protein
MSFEFFKIRIADPSPEQGRLNAFLRSHRILSVRQEWVADGGCGCLMVRGIPMTSGSEHLSKWRM